MTRWLLGRLQPFSDFVAGIRLAGIRGAGTLLAMAVLQAAAAILTIGVFSTVAAAAARAEASVVLGATCALGGLVAAQRVLETAADPIGMSVARRVDVAFRSRLARRVDVPAGIGFRESRGFQADAAAVRADFQGHSPGTATVAVFALSGKIIVAAWCFTTIALYSIVAACAAVIVVVARRQLQQRAFERLYASWGEAGGSARTYDYWRMFHLDPAAADEVRIFGLADWAVARFREAAHGRFAPVWAGRRAASRHSWLAVAAAAAGAFMLLAVLAVGHGLDIAAVATVIGAGLTVLRVTEPAGENLAIEYARPVYAAAARMERAVDKQIAVDLHRTSAGSRASAVSTAGPPTIVLERVGFAYDDRHEPVLRGLELRLQAGSTVGLVGENGSGKTTLTKIIAGLYRPTEGAVQIDGVDLAESDPDSWFRRIAVLPQSFIHYDLPLRANVTLGAPEKRGDAEFFAGVSRRLGIEDLVERLPAGWETHLGSGAEGGVDLSGGEWQRVGLARIAFAVEAGRDVVILDEPTAHLDAEAEALIQEQLDRLSGRVTLLLVSHRLATIRRTDYIALVAGGRVAELGDHDGLVASGGRYAAMYRAQTERFSEVAAGRS